MKRLLRLNDNSEYPIARCGEAQGYLWITVIGFETLDEVSRIFSDKEKTCHLTETYDYAGAPATDYDGFTHLILLQKTRLGVTLCLGYETSDVANPVPET